MNEHPWRTAPEGADGGGPSPESAQRSPSSAGRGRTVRRRPAAGSVLAACGALVVGLLGGLGIGTAVAAPGQTSEDQTTDGTTTEGSAGQLPGGPPPGALPGGGTAPDGTTGVLPDGGDGTVPGGTLPGGTAPDATTGAVSAPVTYVVQATTSTGDPGEPPPPHVATATSTAAVVERREV